jgi:hypothetical protein
MSARVLAAAVLVFAMAVPLEARPRHRRGSSPYVDREGFLIGFSVGAGAIGPDPCTDCGVSAGGEIHVGAMASSYADVAVMLEAGGVARDDLHHGFLVAVAQWWPDPFERFWLRAGGGIGWRGGDVVTEHRDAAYPTALAAVGYEVVRSDRFAADLQLQGAATREPGRWGHSLSVNVGFNWY